MAVILLETNAFAEKFKAASMSVAQTRSGWPYGSWWRNTGNQVRRPYSGLDLKEDTVAQLIIMDAGGKVIQLASNQDGKSSNLWTNFTLQSVTESRAEKMQLVETFGESYVFFYGEQPRVIACSGMLVNSRDHNWRAEFWRNYDQNFRGSKLVEKNAIAYLMWDDIIVQGYIIGANARESATDPYQIPFAFNMLVHRYENIGPVVSATDGKDLVLNSLLFGMALLGDKQQFMIGDTTSIAEFTKGQRTIARTSLIQLLTPRYGAGAAEQADKILEADSFNALNTRLKNLQSESGMSFMDALKEYFLNPTKMFNLAQNVASGNVAGVAAGLGYGVFNAAQNSNALTPGQKGVAGALDPLAVGTVGLARLSDMGASDAELGRSARDIFSPSAFTVSAVSIGHVYGDSNTVDIPGSLEP